MAFDLDDLLACLSLTPGGDGFEGANLDIGYHRVFGGQILAQVLCAAAEAAPDKSVKSMHVLFPREGDTARPMQYRVDQVQAGRTFSTTEVVAHQDGRVAAVALVSMHVDEDGLDRNDPPPPAGPPADATPTDLGMVPWETRLVDGVDLADRGVGPARLSWWMRTPGFTTPDGLPERAAHQALLAHATDLTLIGTALRPLEGVSQADSTVTLHTAVTSHTVWFHRPFRIDDWLLVSQEAPVVAHGRSYGRGDVFSGDELVASFAQEAMIRQIAAPG
ncbi:MAG: thioesterase family protein [Acidobacteria bacterium]|nr:thioesterase family protein [Acidobacteriota bacterium]